MNLRILLALPFFSLSADVFAETYHDGDLIFHESQSSQSKAIHEVTNSRWSHVGILFKESGRWIVAEAVQPVQKTPLQSFIQRGKNGSYRIYRLLDMGEEGARKLRSSAESYLGKSYDIYFEWSDDLIYCSEFVYKAFMTATGHPVGRIQKFRDLNLRGPYAKELIRRRLKDTGRELNINEPIVTPVSQIEDPQLVLVEKHD